MNKHDILKQYFGHESFRTGQERIIDSILEGRDAMAIIPTGAGKSLWFWAYMGLFGRKTC